MRSTHRAVPPKRTCPPFRSGRTAGFTLLELLVVLALLAIVTAAVAMSLREPLKRARLERVLAQLEDLDRHARAEARRHGRAVELRFDAEQGMAYLIDPAGGPPSNARRRVALSGGIEIERLRAPGGRTTSDTLRVVVSPSGQSDPYAVGLRAGRARATWLLVVGTTGQCVRNDEEAAVEKLVSMQN